MKGAALVLTSTLILAGAPATVRGEVNCNQVRRYAETGRSAEDISETMVVPLDQVKNCLQTGEQKPAPTPSVK